MLTAVERMSAATTLPLVVMPNAGMPRAVDGRNIYLCSPEYMASFARKFLKAGVQFIGGCCGTTPNHIRAMKSAMRALEAQKVSVQTRRKSPIVTRDAASAARRTLEHRPSDSRRRLRRHGRNRSAKGIDTRKELEGAAFWPRWASTPSMCRILRALRHA